MVRASSELVKKFFIILLISTVQPHLELCSACTGKTLATVREGSWPGPLRIGVVGSEEGFFPTLGRVDLKAFARDTLAAGVLGQLVYLDRGTLLPGLVSRWRNDGRYWRLSLRDGLKFHNGRKANCVDLEYSLLRYLLTPYALPEKNDLYIISGAREVRAGTFRSGFLRSVQCLSSGELQIELEANDPAFIRMLSSPYFSLVPYEELESDHIAWKRAPIGCGPYKVADVITQPRARIRLQFTQENGFLSHHAIPEIDLLSDLQDSRLAMIVGNGPADVAEPFKLIAGGMPSRVFGIFFNFDTDLGRSRVFRQSVLNAIDRTTLAAELQGGYRSSNVFSSLPGCELPFNRSRSDDSSLVQQSIVIPFVYGDVKSPTWKWARELERQFQAASLPISVQFKPNAFPLAAGPGAAPLSVVGFIPDVHDALQFYSLFAGGGPWVTSSVNPDYDTVLSEARQAVGEKRLTLIGKLAKLFSQDILAIPLVAQPISYWYVPSQVAPSSIGLEQHYLQFHALRRPEGFIQVK